MRRKAFSFVEMGRPRWDALRYSETDLKAALRELHGALGHDLGSNDPSDDAFVDYAGDVMSDARVPFDLVDEMQAWLRAGAPYAVRGKR